MKRPKKQPQNSRPERRQQEDTVHVKGGNKKRNRSNIPHREVRGFMWSQQRAVGMRFLLNFSADDDIILFSDGRLALL